MDGLFELDNGFLVLASLKQIHSSLVKMFGGSDEPKHRARSEQTSRKNDDDYSRSFRPQEIENSEPL
jgi:hypothetical protein